VPPCHLRPIIEKRVFLHGFHGFYVILRQKHSKSDFVNCCKNLQKLQFFNAGPSIFDAEFHVDSNFAIKHDLEFYDLTAQRCER